MSFGTHGPYAATQGADLRLVRLNCGLQITDRQYPRRLAGRALFPADQPLPDHAGGLACSSGWGACSLLGRKYMEKQTYV